MADDARLVEALQVEIRRLRDARWTDHAEIAALRVESAELADETPTNSTGFEDDHGNRSFGPLLVARHSSGISR